MDTSKLKRFMVSLGLADEATGEQITPHEQLNLVAHLNHAYGVTREMAHSAVAHHGLLPKDFLKAWDAFEEDAPAITEGVKESVAAVKETVQNVKEVVNEFKGKKAQAPAAPKKEEPVKAAEPVKEEAPVDQKPSEETQQPEKTEDEAAANKAPE